MAVDRGQAVTRLRVLAGLNSRAVTLVTTSVLRCQLSAVSHQGLAQ
jgi:hypothetical protein